MITWHHRRICAACCGFCIGLASVAKIATTATHAMIHRSHIRQVQCSSINGFRTAAQLQPDETQTLINEAYNLTLTAYQLVGSNPYISNDTRRQINTAISTVQTLLSISPIDYNSLRNATANLRSQLQAAGLI